jgi:hypothetical protein
MKLALTLLFCLLSTMAFADGPVRHIVHFKFQDDAKPEQIQRIVDEFAGLQKSIKEIVELEAGTDVSPEGLSKGFKHCWIVTFRNEADRDIYLKHPAHVEFVKLLKPVLADVMVVDIIPKK